MDGEDGSTLTLQALRAARSSKTKGHVPRGSRSGDPRQAQGGRPEAVTAGGSCQQGPPLTQTTAAAFPPCPSASSGGPTSPPVTTCAPGAGAQG